MSYIKRNKEGSILSTQSRQDENHKEYLKNDDPELQSFHQQLNESNKLKETLSGSDNEMVRVIDDLIHLLVEKQVFVFTELPEAVQAKLNARSKIRDEMNPLSELVSDSDQIF